MTPQSSLQDRIVVCVLAHNEERRISACLNSLPLDDPRFEIHVVVNGSRDRTAQIAWQVVGTRAVVHEWSIAGKSRSWDRLVFDSGIAPARAWIFVDGDAVVLPGSFAALLSSLYADPAINASSGMPCNGRKAEHYRAMMLRDHGLFGDLYALRGSFVERMRSAGIRLPNDLIGDDGLIAAIAKTDLADESGWADARVAPCEGAGFLCEPVRMLSPRTWTMQYRRMRNYSLRHFQNQIISGIMRSTGPSGLPRELKQTYAGWVSRFTARKHPQWWWFDRLAIGQMRKLAQV